MKKIIIVLCLLGIVFQTKATKYTFSGPTWPAMNWTNVAYWSPNYPGTVINVGDTIEIAGTNVKVNTNVQLNGVMIINNINTSWGRGLMVVGSNTFTVGSTGVIHNYEMIGIEDYSTFEIFGLVDVSGNNGYDFLYLNDSASLVIHPGGNLYVEDSLFLMWSGSSIPQCSVTVNGTLTNDGTIYNALGCVINGTGSIVTSTSTANGNIVGLGSVAPGLSPGELKMDFDYALSSNGSLEIEIGGTIPGTDYDVLGGNGDKVLNGTLDVLLYNNFVPTAGYNYTIVKGGSITGTFGTINYPPLPNNMTWAIEYITTEVVLKVNAATRINDTELARKIKVYPNPTNGILNVRVPESEKYEYSVYSVAGSLVQSGKLEGDSKLYLNTRQTGHYYLLLLDKNNHRVMKSFSIMDLD